MNPAVQDYEKLKAFWDKKDYKQCKALLAKLKVALTRLSFLPTDKLPSQQELLFAREVLEFGAKLSLETKEIDEFERYIAQLKTYYFDYSSALPESPYRYQYLGLNLMCLLSKNQIASFHKELERLNPSLLKSNIYISQPVALEQYLMEGSYNKIILSRSSPAAPSYVIFMDRLIETIRREIGDCCEVAYRTLTLKDAADVLFCSSLAELEAFILARGWRVEGSNIVFDGLAPVSRAVNTDQLINRTLDYARELEQIV